MYKDLREFIELVDKLGALRRIEGADPRFEIGAITEIAAGRSDGPALLFDAARRSTSPSFRRPSGTAMTAAPSSARARS
jgi:4-hydroxy-3-polyprenylbenzoate decarboxylase